MDTPQDPSLTGDEESDAIVQEVLDETSDDNGTPSEAGAFMDSLLRTNKDIKTARG